MNPIRFNQRLKQALTTAPDYRHIKHDFEGWETAPLFDYVTNWNKEHVLLGDNLQVAQLREAHWPFEKLRMELTETDIPLSEKNPAASLGTYRNRIVAAREPDGHFSFLVEVVEFGHDNDVLRQVSPFFILITCKLMDTAARLDFTPDELDAGWCFSYAYNGKWAKRDIYDRKGILYRDAGRQALLGIRPYVQGILAAFHAFVLDCASPTNHLALVRPPKKGRTVEWVKARTHYTLITHGHPANKKELIREDGTIPTIKGDHVGELTRMAGNRKGHWRTYRHPRYTYARGDTRWIKSTWVGPKEWIGEGGHQIYKILEPVEQEAAA